MTPVARGSGVGTMLKGWRQRRRLSQLDLSVRAGVSTRHLSFVETGRSRPSRELLLHLAEHLDVPGRERDGLLLAAGFAPAFGRRDLSGDDLAAVRQALGVVLHAHEPFPALIVDRGWDLVAANTAASLLIEGVDPALLVPPVNALRLSLHPDGMGARVANLAKYSAHVLGRLRREAEATADPALVALHDELAGYRGVEADGAVPPEGAIVTPMRLRTESRGELSFFTTIATFGTAVDVTVAELAVEQLLPADEHTATALGATTNPGSTTWFL